MKTIFAWKTCILCCLYDTLKQDDYLRKTIVQTYQITKNIQDRKEQRFKALKKDELFYIWDVVI